MRSRFVALGCLLELVRIGFTKVNLKVGLSIDTTPSMYLCKTELMCNVLSSCGEQGLDQNLIWLG